MSYCLLRESHRAAMPGAVWRLLDTQRLSNSLQPPRLPGDLILGVLMPERESLNLLENSQGQTAGLAPSSD